jgi:hypothetical protein
MTRPVMADSGKDLSKNAAISASGATSEAGQDAGSMSFARVLQEVDETPEQQPVSEPDGLAAVTVQTVERNVSESASVQILPPVEHILPPVEHILPPVEQVLPPVEQVLPPVEQVLTPVEQVLPPVEQNLPPVAAADAQAGFEAPWPQTGTDGAGLAVEPVATAPVLASAGNTQAVAAGASGALAGRGRAGGSHESAGRRTEASVEGVAMRDAQSVAASAEKDQRPFELPREALVKATSPTTDAVGPRVNLALPSGAEVAAAPATAAGAPTASVLPMHAASGLNLGLASGPGTTFDVDGPMNTARWESAVGGRLVWLARNGVQSAQLTLNPPNLGRLDVRVGVEQDQVSVQIVSAHAPVRDALEAALPRFRDMMSEGGLNLADVDISHHQEGTAGEFDQHSRDDDGGAGTQGQVVISSTQESVADSAVRELSLVDAYV